LLQMCLSQSEMYARAGGESLRDDSTRNAPVCLNNRALKDVSCRTATAGARAFRKESCAAKRLDKDLRR